MCANMYVWRLAHGESEFCSHELAWYSHAVGHCMISVYDIVRTVDGVIVLVCIVYEARRHREHRGLAPCWQVFCFHQERPIEQVQFYV